MSSSSNLPFGFFGFAGQHAFFAAPALDVGRQPVVGYKALFQRYHKISAEIGKVRRDEKLTPDAKGELISDLMIDRDILGEKIDPYSIRGYNNRKV